VTTCHPLVLIEVHILSHMNDSVENSAMVVVHVDVARPGLGGYSVRAVYVEITRSRFGGYTCDTC
jgi:hypothetical protein